MQRALERENFKPTPYYVVEVTVDVDGEQLKLSTDRIDEEARAREIVEAVKSAGGALKVIESVGEKVRMQPPKPLDTVELERRASRFLNVRAKNALDVAEDLYRYGLISYPRTETTIYPKTLDLRRIVRDLAKVKDYGGDYVRANLAGELRPTSGGSSDNAHPPQYIQPREPVLGM